MQRRSKEDFLDEILRKVFLKRRNMGKGKYPKYTVYYDSFDHDFERVENPRAQIRSFNYKKRGICFRLARFFLHDLIAAPIAYLYSRVILGDRVIGKSKLNGIKSFVLYSNHTEPVGDALAPHTFVFPKRALTVVSPKNLEIPVIGRLIPYLGAVPTPSDIRSSREFSQCIKREIDRGCALIVFPEAHVWKKYTGIRPMSISAFDIARRYSVPAFSATRVYRRSRLFGYRCRIYIDGPFYADTSLPLRESCEDMMRRVDDTMRSRAELSDVEIIRYLRNGE